jgi:hypothetical protein
MYGACMPLSQSERIAWAMDAKNINLLMRTIDNWLQKDAVTVACWAREDMQPALLQGEMGVAILSAFK